MTRAAITGPTPDRLVRLVPLALTAAAGRALAAGSWAPGWRRSATCSAASWWRASAAGPDGPGLPGRRVAWAGVISSAMPPGTRLASRGVQPACGLVAEPGQVTVPFGP